MPNSPRMTFPIPPKDSDPWYDAFVAMVGAIDTSAYAAREDRGYILTGGGNVSFTASTGDLAWDAALVFPSPIVGFQLTLAATSVVLGDGQILYADVTRSPSAPVTLTAVTASQLPSTDTALLLAVRIGSAVYWRNGARLLDGDNRSLFDSGGGGGDMAIGSPVTGGTAGSVLFVDSSGDLGQNNANLFWDRTHLALGIGTNNPGEGYGVAADISLGIRRAGANFILIDNVTASADAGIYIQTAAENLDACIFVDETDSQKLKFATGTFSGHSSRVSNTWMSIDQAGTVAVRQALDLTYVTSGRVLFVSGSSGAVAQDANFNWDPSTHNLTLGPGGQTGDTLTVTAGGAGSSCMCIRSTNAAGYSVAVFHDYSNAEQGAMGYANPSAPASFVAGKNYIFADTVDWVFANPTQVQLTVGMTAGSASLQFADGAYASVSASGTGKFRYNNSATQFEQSINGGGWTSFGGGSGMGIGVAVTSGTSGSVLFVDAGHNLAQDNSNFFWDGTSHCLRVGASAVATAYASFPLTVSTSSSDIVSYMWNTSASGFSAVGFLDNSLTYRCIVGYGNSGAAGVLAGHAFIDTNGVDLIVVDGVSGHVEFQFGMTDGSTFVQLADGAGAAVSPANTARVIWNNGTGKLQVSKNGAAYVDILTL